MRAFKTKFSFITVANNGVIKTCVCALCLYSKSPNPTTIPNKGFDKRDKNIFIKHKEYICYHSTDFGIYFTRSVRIKLHEFNKIKILFMNWFKDKRFFKL